MLGGYPCMKYWFFIKVSKLRFQILLVHPSVKFYHRKSLQLSHKRMIRAKCQLQSPVVYSWTMQGL